MDGDTYWVWQERMADGWETILSSTRVGTLPLMHSDPRLVKGAMWHRAQAHALQTGRAIRLARFEMQEVVEES